MTTPSLTPLDIERGLRHLVTDLSRAQAALGQARDIEVDARHAYDRASAAPCCPRSPRR